MHWRPGRGSAALAARTDRTRGRGAVAAAAGVTALVIAVAATVGWVFTGRALARSARPRLAPAVTGTVAQPAALRTSCTSVGHIGDSTSVGVVSPTWLPVAAQRLAAQYQDVGVRHAWIDASGGRSIVEQLPGQLNGYRVASGWYRAGFRGCWVIALGTNDAANVSAGSSVGMMARVQEMMAAVHGEPVMWVNTQTDLTSGPWSESNMQQWNATLVQASKEYPNMRIFDWAAMVEPSWHLSDGIHYTSAGNAIRAAAIAQALARAFPPSVLAAAPWLTRRNPQLAAPATSQLLVEQDT